MSASSKLVVFWCPRILSIVFIGFLSLFALDVFSEGHGLWETIGHLIMHLIPTFLLIGILWIAWRREWVGAILFGVAGVVLLSIVRARWLDRILIGGPALIVAGLFLVNWLKRSELHTRP
jgi:hypothetical protein